MGITGVVAVEVVVDEISAESTDEVTVEETSEVVGNSGLRVM